MEGFHAETEATPGRLLDEVRHLHPGLKFCGEPKNAILNVSDDLLNYVLSLLKDDPIHAPRVSIAEWSELLHILKAHWVLPLLYWYAGRLPEEFQPPKPILESMRTAFQWSRARCFHMENQLGEITAAFKDEGVRVLVLKGPAYGRTVYPDPALRPASDLDLLVRPEEMLRSRAILEGLGYKCEARLFDAEEILYKDEKFVHRENPGKYRAIELHWKLHFLLGIGQEAETDELFARAARVESSPITFEALDAVDAVIHTAINNAFGHDNTMRLIWICDAALLARKLVVPDDWKLLQKRCIDWRARLAVELSLGLAKAWLGLSLPRGFEDFSEWPQPTDIEADGWSRMISRHHRLLSLIKLRMPKDTGFLEKARLFARLVFPLREKVCCNFPPPHDLLFPISYIRRWWYWGGKLRS